MRVWGLGPWDHDRRQHCQLLFKSRSTRHGTFLAPVRVIEMSEFELVCMTTVVVRSQHQQQK